ncbi:Fur family transcriptional regulator [Geoalkalibacter halelectricus]|uniref:Transcriptional repressor n=1 Tax=Geoalkalibacter halelectricus TaxID=2847045 RepID=A0ABY5ZI10_9BACT|nr:transcriptional repressor [Geoalkalibacter halelectricus]MDO3378962.1 transcriptional repressor [Geoalkalibacter halelectricus]UWZ78778.1 transcriptional repressor [Geoalkalibacter halelectricus]
MTDPELRLTQMISKLRTLDFRITPQRLAVLKILAHSTGHPTIEWIYEEVRRDFPTVSLATIYKTATLLKGLGEVVELETRDGRHRFDGNKPYPHPHVICTQCKQILDFEDASLETLIREVSAKTGYEISDHQLDFFGLCPQCRKEIDPSDTLEQ